MYVGSHSLRSLACQTRRFRPDCFHFLEEEGAKKLDLCILPSVRSNPRHSFTPDLSLLLEVAPHLLQIPSRSMGNVLKISVPFQSLVRNFKSDDIVPETISREAHVRRESGERCYIARKRYLSSLVPSGECRMPLSLSLSGGRERGREG